LIKGFLANQHYAGGLGLVALDACKDDRSIDFKEGLAVRVYLLDVPIVHFSTRWFSGLIGSTAGNGIYQDGRGRKAPDKSRCVSQLLALKQGSEIYE
jgi:hypothetical protein